MKKNTIKLNENQLKQIISNTLNEMLGSSSGPDAPGPSQDEEQFEDELYSFIDSYKDFFLSHGFKPQEFCDWCCEIVRNACR